MPPPVKLFLRGPLGALGGIARRAHRALEGRLLAEIQESEREEVTAAFARANADLERLTQRFELETRPC